MSKKKHKLRAITNAEYCDKWKSKHHRCCTDYDLCMICPLSFYPRCFDSQKPFRFADGKYIFIEVKE